MPPGMMPAPMILPTHSPAASDDMKPTSTARAVSGFLQDAHRHLGDDAEQAFRAGDDAEQVVALGIEMLAADAQHLAGDQHDLAAEHVVGGHAVFQAMHAAGILRDVAADAAGDLRGRVGRVVEALVRHRLRDRQIGDARLDHGDAVLEIDLAHAVELAEAEQHAVGERQRAAGERGARPARHHADVVRVAIAQHPRHLLGRLRQHHHERKLAVGGEPVRTRRGASRARSRSRPRPARSRSAPRRSRRAARARPDPVRASSPTSGHQGSHHPVQP